MPRKISDEKRQLIEDLYARNLSTAEIAKRAKVSNQTAYGYTKLRERINTETKNFFESINQYNEYKAKQRINPKTGQTFESQSQYERYTAKQRQERPENQKLGNLIKKRLKELGKNQSWLAEEIDVTNASVSSYVKGKYIPRNDLLERLYSALEVPYQTLDDLLE